MSEELLEAFIAKGYDARIFDLSPDNMPTEGTLFFMNTNNSLQDLPPALFTPDSNMRAIQYYVDHPFGLSDGSIDQWNQINALSNYRLALPCIDDAHLLRYRFPNIVQLIKSITTLFDWSGTNLTNAREKIDELLANPGRALQQAIRGRVHAEKTCLWEHRVDQMFNLVDSCPRPEPQTV